MRNHMKNNKFVFYNIHNASRVSQRYVNYSITSRYCNVIFFIFLLQVLIKFECISSVVPSAITFSRGLDIQLSKYLLSNMYPSKIQPILQEIPFSNKSATLLFFLTALHPHSVISMSLLAKVEINYYHRFTVIDIYDERISILIEITNLARHFYTISSRMYIEYSANVDETCFIYEIRTLTRYLLIFKLSLCCASSVASAISLC